MNFTGHNFYTFDQPYHHVHNGDTGEYIQTATQSVAGVKDENYRNVNFIPIHQTTDAHYSPMFDPYLHQTINAPLYSLQGNNALPYSYNFPNVDTNIDRCYLGMNNQGRECYNSMVNFSQLRPYVPQINYQSNQITVVPNIQINSTDSVTYSANNFIEIGQNSKELLPQYADNRLVPFRGQEVHRKPFKCQRNKIKSAAYKHTNMESKDTSVHRSSESLTSDSIADSLSINTDSCIEVLVTNLDYNIGAKEWKKLLFNQFQSALKRIHSVYIQTQTDGSNCALVRVNSIEDARLAISQFHRKKIGYKRIQVNLVNGNSTMASGNVKQEVASLLKSVAGYSLSLFKFMELYEKRYHRNISISDFYKMKDFVEIKDVGGNQNGKIISLTNMAINYIDQTMESSETGEIFESTICSLHCKDGTEDYLAAIDSSSLPNVDIKLKLLKDQVHQIIQSHNGDVPLLSFLSCYKADFNSIRTIKVQKSSVHPESLDSESPMLIHDVNEREIESLENFDEIGAPFEGVPLEHLLNCITGIKITTSAIEIKKIQWEDKKGSMTSINNGLGGILVDRLHQFSREVVDLIKHQPGCRILLSKFIPTYHHHFGKQCRVADYGFSKLHELIDALPQVVHVIGFGYMRILYLSHKVQVRRFTNEVMKVLKSQSTKTCTLSKYPTLYKLLFHKEFRVTDYGVCYLDDLIEDIPDSTVEIVREESEIYVSMPKRIQTVEEKERTTKFATEVVDLLKETPRCKLPFNKFIPSYHHHFSRQCKVAEYGFTKLIELLEAIPFVVQIVEEHGEKYVFLTQYEMLRVLGDQTLTMLEKSLNKRVQLSEFLNVYLKSQGYALNIEDFMVKDLKQLIGKIPKIAKIQSCPLISVAKADSLSQSEKNSEVNDITGLLEKTDLFVCLADRNHVKYLAHKVLLVLLEVPSGALLDYQFVDKYRHKYREEPSIAAIQDELYDIVQVVNDSTSISYPGSNGLSIGLKPLILFSRDLKDLIRFNQGKMSFMQLEPIYEQQYGTALKPQNYGYTSLLGLIQACDFVVTIKGRGIRATLVLNQDFVGKLAYRVAYSTEPLSNTSSDNENAPYEIPEQNLAPQSSSSDSYDQSFHQSANRANTQMPASLLPTKQGCIATLMYNHYINPPNNFLQPMNSYHYYNTQSIYNAWIRQWYPPHAPYGYPQNMYPPPEYGVLPLTQNELPQACPSYLPAVSQDQKQIDELVETLAYDSSCSSRMTPPPPVMQHMQPSTFEATNTLIPNPWMSYSVPQILSQTPFHGGYQTVLPTPNGEEVMLPAEHVFKSMVPQPYNVMDSLRCSNNSNAISVIENHSKNLLSSLNSHFCPTRNISTFIS